MATGFQLNSAFGFIQRYKAFSNMGSYTILRKEADIGLPKHWMWINFYFGTDYSGTPRTISLSDTLGGESSTGGSTYLRRR